MVKHTQYGILAQMLQTKSNRNYVVSNQILNMIEQFSFLLMKLLSKLLNPFIWAIQFPCCK